MRKSAVVESSILSEIADGKNSDVINFSVKFIGRYVPKPRPKQNNDKNRRGTLLQTKNSEHIVEENLDLDDALLDADDKVDDLAGAAAYADQRFAHISSISKGSAGLLDSATTMMQSLQRMTTIRHIFESYDLDISKNSFADIYSAMQQSRDFSEAALNELWESSLNAPLEAGQKVSCQTVIILDDCYGLLEGLDLIVFDS